MVLSDLKTESRPCHFVKRRRRILHKRFRTRMRFGQRAGSQARGGARRARPSVSYSTPIQYSGNSDLPVVTLNARIGHTDQTGLLLCLPW